MRWIEPRPTAQARAEVRNSLFNPPRLVFLRIVCCAAGFAGLFIVLVWLQLGAWRWPVPLMSGALGATIGASVGFFQSRARRERPVQQEIELHPHSFWIRGTREFTLRYDQLRAYSIVTRALGGATHRLLFLYPEDDGFFSIGIAPGITDEDLHSVLSGSLPFQTIIDEKALKFPG